MVSPLGRVLKFGDQEVNLKQRIAEGGSARIYLASCANQLYAVKHLSICDLKVYNDAITEVYLHLRFNNEKCVVRLHGLLVDSTYIPADFACFDRYLTQNKMHSSQSMAASSVHSSQFMQIGHSMSQMTTSQPAPIGPSDHNSKKYDPKNVSTSPPCKDIHLLLEYCGGGNCVTLLKKCSERKVFLPEPLIWRFAYNITLAVLCLHSKGCSHRDLKLENILVLESYELDDILINNGCTSRFPELLRLCDFGSCTTESYSSEDLRDIIANDKHRMEDLMRSLELKTTPCFRAPEQIRLDPEFPLGTAVDVFAFGILLYRLMYRRLPFPDNDLGYNYRSEFKFQDDRIAYSDALKKIVSLCLIQHPKNRVDIFEVHKLVREEVRRLGFIETKTNANIDRSQNLGRSTRVSILHAVPESAHLPAMENTVNIVLAYKPMLKGNTNADITVNLEKDDSGNLDLSQVSIGNFSILEDAVASVMSASQTLTGVDTGQSLSCSKQAFPRSVAESIGINMNMGLSVSGMPHTTERTAADARDNLTASAISATADPRAAYPGRFMMSSQNEVGLSESIMMVLESPTSPQLGEDLRTNLFLNDNTNVQEITMPNIPRDSLSYKAYSLLQDSIKNRPQTKVIYEGLHEKLKSVSTRIDVESFLPILLKMADLIK